MNERGTQMGKARTTRRRKAVSVLGPNAAPCQRKGAYASANQGRELQYPERLASRKPIQYNARLWRLCIAKATNYGVPVALRNSGQKREKRDNGSLLSASVPVPIKHVESNRGEAPSRSCRGQGYSSLLCKHPSKMTMSVSVFPTRHSRRRALPTDTVRWLCRTGSVVHQMVKCGASRCSALRGWYGKESFCESGRHTDVMVRVPPSLADGQPNLNLPSQRGSTAPRHALRARIRAWLCMHSPDSSAPADKLHECMT